MSAVHGAEEIEATIAAAAEAFGVLAGARIGQDGWMEVGLLSCEALANLLAPIAKLGFSIYFVDRAVNYFLFDNRNMTAKSMKSRAI